MSSRKWRPFCLGLVRNQWTGSLLVQVVLCLIACTAPSHHLKQWPFLENRDSKNKHEWTSNSNTPFSSYNVPLKMHSAKYLPSISDTGLNLHRLLCTESWGEQYGWPAQKREMVIYLYFEFISDYASYWFHMKHIWLCVMHCTCWRPITIKCKYILAH